mgnify:CR=1 FL=1
MLSKVEDAIEAIRLGQMVIVVDDEDRENEGDLIMAAEAITAEAVNFMATHGRGLICCPITAARAKELELSYMVSSNTCPFETAFTISVDAKYDTTTGISAHERALTIKRLSDPAYDADAFMSPGHMFPLIAKDGGVRERRGQTEASIDLAKLGGFEPAGVICEIMNDDGSMARLPDLVEYAKKHNLYIISIEQMVQYLEKQNSL